MHFDLFIFLFLLNTSTEEKRHLSRSYTYICTKSSKGKNIVAILVLEHEQQKLIGHKQDESKEEEEKEANRLRI